MSALFFALTSITSCDKVEKLLFKTFESPLSFDIEIPVISTTESETEMGSTTVFYNLDQEIKKNAGDKFGADIVGAMYINNLAVTLLESDQDNDLSNFDYIKLAVSTAGSAPATFGPFNISSGSINSTSFKVSERTNIRPYFNGSNVFLP